MFELKPRRIAKQKEIGIDCTFATISRWILQLPAASTSSDIWHWLYLLLIHLHFCFLLFPSVPLIWAGLNIWCECVCTSSSIFVVLVLSVKRTQCFCERSAKVEIEFQFNRRKIFFKWNALASNRIFTCENWLSCEPDNNNIFSIT